MADENQATVKDIFMQEAMKVIRKGGTEEEAKKAGQNAVKQSGWYLKNGKWKKRITTTRDNTAFKNRSDENTKLAKFKIKNTMRYA